MVQRSRYLSLETIAALSDNHRQPARYCGLIDPGLLEIMVAATSKLYHAMGHDLEQPLRRRQP
jgi:hypothetical protein